MGAVLIGKSPPMQAALLGGGLILPAMAGRSCVTILCGLPRGYKSCILSRFCASPASNTEHLPTSAPPKMGSSQ